MFVRQKFTPKLRAVKPAGYRPQPWLFSEPKVSDQKFSKFEYPPLIRRIVNTFRIGKGSVFMREDLLQEAWMAMNESSYSLREDATEAEKITYTKMVIVQRLIAFIKNHHRGFRLPKNLDAKFRASSLNDLVSDEEKRPIEKADLLFEAHDAKADNSKIGEMLSRLTFFDRSILKNSYAIGHAAETLVELSNKLGPSKSSIQRRRDSLLRLLESSYDIDNFFDNTGQLYWNKSWFTLENLLSACQTRGICMLTAIQIEIYNQKWER